MGAFEITRRNGRSNARVVLDYVKDGEPGRVYTYEELGGVLSEGTTRLYSVVEVRRIVTGLYTRMLKEQQRALQNLRQVGYRLAHATDHKQLALERKGRAEVQLHRGLLTVEQVRWEELDPAARQVMEGMLLVMSGLYQQQTAMDQRLRVIEDAVKNLKGVTAA